jgi:broad specificity phosphatase PhoE
MIKYNRRLFLVRHGETYSNRYGREAIKHTPYGVSQHSLTERGRRQAEALVDVLTKEQFSAVYCSSALRCQETLHPYLLTGHVSRDAVIFHDDLLEIDNDIVVLIHHLAETVPTSSPDNTNHEFTSSRVPPETANEFEGRVCRVLSAALTVPTGDILIVSHHGTNNTIMKSLLTDSSWSFRHQHNACINVVHLDTNRLAQLVVVNSVVHLSAELRAEVNL